MCSSSTSQHTHADDVARAAADVAPEPGSPSAQTDLAQHLLLSIIVSGAVKCADVRALWVVCSKLLTTPVPPEGFDSTVLRAFSAGLVRIDDDGRITITPAGEDALELADELSPALEAICRGKSN